MQHKRLCQGLLAATVLLTPGPAWSDGGVDANGFGPSSAIPVASRLLTDSPGLTVCRVRPHENPNANYNAGQWSPGLFSGEECVYGWDGNASSTGGPTLQVLENRPEYHWKPWDQDNPPPPEAVGLSDGSAICEVFPEGVPAPGFWLPGKFIFGQGLQAWQCNVAWNGRERYADNSVSQADDSHRMRGKIKLLVSDTTSTVVHPNYFVLSLVYSPPGCTSSPTHSCDVSTVEYTTGSSNGSKVSVSSSFQEGITVTATADVKVPSVGFNSEISGGYTNKVTNSSSQTVTKATTDDLKATGEKDGINHGLDSFDILLNPAVELSKVGDSTQWSLGHSGNFAQKIQVYVKELLDPKGTMRQSVADAFKNAGLTQADFDEILKVDPFARGETQINSSRFSPTEFSFTYEPLLASSDCNGSICHCFGESSTLENDFVNEMTIAYEQNVTVKADVGVKGGVFGVKVGGEWIWTHSKSDQNTRSSTQKATAIISCPSADYKGTALNMDVWWDGLFGSFLFVPVNLDDREMLVSGHVTDTHGITQRYRPVIATIGSRTWRTWTNQHGNFAIYIRKGGSSPWQPGNLPHVVALQIAPGTMRSATFSVPASGARREFTIKYQQEIH